MGKSDFAEALLKTACGQQRATEVVGDLLEMNTGTIAFWWAVAQVIVGMTWRWFAGVIAAAISSLGLIVLLAKFVFLRFGASASPHPALTSALMESSLCIAGVVVVNVVRFGIKDRVTTGGATLVSLLIAAFCASTLPHMNFLLVGIALLLVFAFFHLRTAFMRKSTMIFVAAALGYAGAFDSLMQLLPKDPTSATRWVLIVSLFSNWITSIACGAWVLSQIRRVALHSQQTGK